jgi:cysteine-rich repeat protein
VNSVAGEACDDKNENDSDGCSATCKREVNLPCTADAQCATGLICDATPQQKRCERVNYCGNGRVETGEGCDDGDTIDGDGCSAGCYTE